MTTAGADRALVAALEAELQAHHTQFGLALAEFVAGSCAALLLVSGLMWLIFPHDLQFLLLTGLLGLLVAAGALYRFLHRQGRSVLGARLFTIVLLLAVSVGVWLVPELLPIAGLGFVLVVLVGVYALSDRAARWLIACSVVAYSAVYALSEIGGFRLFAPLDRPADRLFLAGLALAGFAAIGLALRALVANQEGQYRQALLANTDLEKRMASMREQRDRLQRANASFANRALAEREQREEAERLLLRVRDAASDLSALANDLQTAMNRESGAAGEQSDAIEQLAGLIGELVPADSRPTAAQAAQAVRLARAVLDVDQATVQGRASARQAEHAAQQLGALARRLNRMLACD
jgi:hypothetical protein